MKKMVYGLKSFKANFQQFSEDYPVDKVKELVTSFRNKYKEYTYDIGGDFFKIKVDKYFESEDPLLRNACLDIFGYKLWSTLDGWDYVWLHESYLRIINRLLELRPNKHPRVLLLINFIDHFRKNIHERSDGGEESNWFGKNSSKKKEREVYEKSKEIFGKINQLDLTLTDEEMKIIKDIGVIDIYAEFYLDSIKDEQGPK